MSQDSESSQIEKAIAEIYSQPITGFISARDTAAKRLKQEGKDEAAKAVSKLRKPTLPAWALTRLAVTDPSSLDPLDDADERVREAMSGSKAADRVRKATEARHRVISDIVDAAADLLEEEGHPASTTVREKIAQTIYALASNDSRREKLAQGQVTKELQPSGFDWGPVPEAAPVEAEPGEDMVTRKRLAKLQDAAEAAEKRAANLALKLEDVEGELRALEKEAAELRRHAARAASDAQEKRREADEATSR
jgi:hypothetical protein